MTRKFLIRLIVVVFVLGAIAKCAGCDDDDADSAEAKAASEAPQKKAAVKNADKIPESPAGDFKYTLTEDGRGVKISEYIGKSEIVRIPAEIEGVPVTEIGRRAFYSKHGVTCVVIPDSVTKMGEYTFEFAKGLEQVVLPKNLEAIPLGCFHNCIALGGVEIPNSTLKIEPEAFWASGIRSIEIPKGVAFVGAVDPKDNEKIEAGANVFHECRFLKSVSLPEGINAIGWRMFYSCESLESIKIPSSVKKIEDGAFSGCKSLKSVILQDGLETVGDAFFHTAIRELVLPDTVTSAKIGDIESLEKIHYSDAMETLENVLGDNLKSINLPKSLKRIKGAVHLPSSITEIVVPEGLSGVDFGVTDFRNLTLTLATQKALRDAGYKGSF